MQRFLISIFLLFTAALSAATAAPRAQTSGDPTIDQQWVQLAGRANAAPVDPHATEPTGIFRIFRGRNATAAPRQRQVTPRARQRTTTTRVRTRQISRAYLPRTVDDPTGERPGTIVIDTRNRYLYRVLENGKAQRYGVGVGREGFGWTGRVRIARKAEWPTWRPPAAMRKRQPYLPASMPGGPDNPLGARALYLFDGGRDTLFRIHGSNEPWTIGQAVSSGCIRMRNEDVIELYNQVKIGTPVVVF